MRLKILWVPNLQGAGRRRRREEAEFSLLRTAACPEARSPPCDEAGAEGSRSGGAGVYLSIE